MSEAAAFPDRKQIFQVAFASIIGSVIEQYDFLVTGVIAATVGAAFSSSCRASPRLPRRSPSMVLASLSGRLER